MSVCQRNFMILESSNKKKWALHFICHFYFIFLQILFLYYFKKVYIHEKLEVKQNGTIKKLALHWDSLGSRARKGPKVLGKHFSSRGSCEKWMSWTIKILQFGQWEFSNLSRRPWCSNLVFFENSASRKNGLAGFNSCLLCLKIINLLVVVKNYKISADG